MAIRSWVSVLSRFVELGHCPFLFGQAGDCISAEFERFLPRVVHFTVKE
jgi:hypothetical protein